MFNKPTITRLMQFTGIFVGLLVAIYAATQSQSAPLLILFIALYVLTSNFSIPLDRTQVSLVPLVAVSSLVIVGFEAALFALVLGLLLAELTRPLWQPLWQNISVEQPRWQLRVGLILLYTAVLTGAALIYQGRGGALPLTVLAGALPAPSSGEITDETLVNLLWLSGSYFFLYLALQWLICLVQRQTPADFVTNNLPLLASFGLLTQTFALFGAFTFTAVGLPAFVIFAVGVALFTIISWVSWQNRVVMRQQVEQFAYLNRIGSSLRETLDLPEVLNRTYKQVTQLIPADSFFIALRDDHGCWECPLAITKGARQTSPPLGTYTPDDLTSWVAEHGRLLDLDPDNMHYANQYNLTLPTPRPDAWLGVPLTTSSKLLGVMVIQRYPPSKPFTYWSRELLLAVAQQASTAIQNARLHAETVRLFNLTDEQLARRVEQITAVLNSTHEGILLLDTAGQIVLINPLATNILGLETMDETPLTPELAQMRLGYPPTELANLLANLAQGIQPQPRREIYSLPTLVSGRPQYIERTERPVLSDEGRIMGWLLVLRDVTEEQEQSQWRKQFTHMVVHDLRNPVTTLLSTLRMLARQLPQAPLEDLAALVETSQTGCHHLLDMVDSLMDINRLEAGQLIVEAEAMRLPPLVEKVLAHMQSLADEKKIVLTAVVDAELPAVWADEELMRRVLVNLLDNALKFTPAHGRVSLQLTTAEEAIPGYEPGLVCAITDSGAGIPPEHRDRIFERFVRISSGGAQVRGTGIGLSFCRLALEAQDGRIWVEDTSTTGVGSRFLFTLPGIPLFEPQALD
jgi:NtrC-family two-component system sensor histidine kinase KinB